jgi:hypothetical protein
MSGRTDRDPSRRGSRFRKRCAKLPPVRSRRQVLIAIAATLGAALAGCSSGPEPEAPAAPGAGSQEPSTYVEGLPDTAGSVPGSANALYIFRFKQTQPSSDRFTFRDRDVSIYFRPSPTALYFRIENLQGRPVTLNWDDCVFYDVNGRTGKAAHGSTRWRDRFSPMVTAQIPGQQQYGDYVFPLDYLVDPGGSSSEEQPHLPIVPENESAPTFSGRTFGVDLAFTVEDRPRTYSFRFLVASVIPR